MNIYRACGEGIGMSGSVSTEKARDGGNHLGGGRSEVGRVDRRQICPLAPMPTMPSTALTLLSHTSI